MNIPFSETGFSDLVIRPLHPEDRGIIDAFYDQMAGETRAFFNPADYNRRRTHRYLDGKFPNSEHFIAVIRQERTETVAGYCFLWDCQFMIPWVGLAVSEDWKGRHLGRNLLSFLIDHTKKTGKGGIMLTTHVSNIRAQALYHRMGFRYMGRHTGGEMLFMMRFPVVKSAADDV